MSFKEQLKNEILPKAVEYYNSGTGINESIVKAASDFNLNLEQTYRLLETMNTARTIAHYEKNAEDRTQNFDIADKDVVRRMLFSDGTEKKASADQGGWFDYSSYDSPERDYLEERTDGSVFTKAAEANEPGVKEFSRRQVIEKVASYKNELTEQHNFASGREEMAKDWLATSISKLASDLSRGYEPERRYAMFKVACGRGDVVSAVEKAMHPSIVKDAAPHVKTLRRSNVFDPSEVEEQLKLAEEVYEGSKLVDRIHSVVESLSRKEAEARDLLAKYQATQTEGKLDFFGYKEAQQGPAGHPRNPPGRNGRNGGNNDDDDHHHHRGAWFGRGIKATYNALAPDVRGNTLQTNINDYISGSLLTPEAISKILDKEDKKEDRTLREEIDNMRRSAILSELYADDDIIKEADPNDVASAYKTLVMAAPDLSLNKEAVRSVLRQSVNSVAVSPFDVKQWADYDKTVAEAREHGLKADYYERGLFRQA
jgi:hypothetical protein